MKAGWDGSRAVWDVEEHIRRGERAYAVEISLVERLGRPDIADKPRENLAKEIIQIRKRDEVYAELFKGD